MVTVQQWREHAVRIIVDSIGGKERKSRDILQMFVMMTYFSSHTRSTTGTGVASFWCIYLTSVDHHRSIAEQLNNGVEDQDGRQRQAETSAFSIFFLHVAGEQERKVNCCDVQD